MLYLIYMYMYICIVWTYRHIHSPGFTTHFRVDLLKHLGTHTHQHCWFTQRTTQDDLTGHWGQTRVGTHVLCTGYSKYACTRLQDSSYSLELAMLSGTSSTYIKRVTYFHCRYLLHFRDSLWISFKMNNVLPCHILIYMANIYTYSQCSWKITTVEGMLTCTRVTYQEPHSSSVSWWHHSGLWHWCPVYRPQAGFLWSCSPW